MATSAAPPTTCPSCSQPIVAGASFCAFCGTQVGPVSAGLATNAAIRKRIDAELSTRLQDQNSMVREIADRVEDVIWKRYTRYVVVVGLLLGGIGATFTWLGYSKLSDVSAKIDPIVNDAVSKAKAAAQNVDQSATKAQEIKADTDRLSATIDAQTKRVTDSGADIRKKLAAFDAAQKQLESSLARAQELSQQVDAVQKSLQTKVQQLSSQVNDVSLRQVYPDLGKKLYVTLNGHPWRNKAEKRPGEAWVNIIIDPLSIGDYSEAQVEQIMADMKQQNFIPNVGNIGVGGPFNQTWFSLSQDDRTSEIVYFQKDMVPNAITLSAVVAKILSRSVPIKFLDPSSVPKDDNRRFILDQSGLDMQLVLGR